MKTFITSSALLLAVGLAGAPAFAAESELIILHRNSTSPWFELEHAEYFVDDVPVAVRDRAVDRSEQWTEAHRGEVAPGVHSVRAQLTLRGVNRGPFTYVDSYRFKVTGRYQVQAVAGQRTILTIQSDEQGGLTETFTKRPTLTHAVATAELPDRTANPTLVKAAEPSWIMEIRPSGRIDTTVYFEFGSAELHVGFMGALDEIAVLLETQPSFERLIVEGHADHVGTEAYNYELSVARAEAVRRYLVEKAGVPPTHVEIFGHGSNRPANRGHDEVARADNRRVEFVLKQAAHAHLDR